MSVGPRIKEARKTLRLNQEEFSARSGIPLDTLRKYEGGSRSPGSEAIAGVARMGVNANWLLTGEGEMLLEPLVLDEAHAYSAPERARRLTASEPRSSSLRTENVRLAQAIQLDDAQYESWASHVGLDDFAPVRYYSQVAVAAGAGALNQDHAPEALLFSRAFLRRVGAHPRQLLLVRVKGDSMHPTLHSGWTVMIDTARRRVDSGIYVIQSGGQETVKRLEARPGGIIRVISDNKLYAEYEVTPEDPDFAVIGEVIWFAGLVQ